MTAEIVAELRAAIGDLEGHIERRAAELAAPIIAAAEEKARQQVAVAEGNLHRADELIAELRIQLDTQTRLHLQLLNEKRERNASPSE